MSLCFVVRFGDVNKVYFLPRNVNYYYVPYMTKSLLLKAAGMELV